jgi:serine/threonine-protein kinase RsbW
MSRLRAAVRLPPRTAASTYVARFIGELSETASLSRRSAYRLRLACDELAANIIEHGYGGQGGGILLYADYSAHCAWLCIEDEASPFDPTAIRRPAPYEGSAPSCEVGGAGLRLVRHSVDHFGYEYSGGRNRTFVAVHREAGESGSARRGGS